MINTKNKILVFGIYFALTLTTFAVFSQVRNFDFINYDDDKYVTENKHVLTGLNRENLTWAFTTAHAENWHPLTWLSHILDCQLFNTNPAGHHLTNLLLHIINTLLLFTVLRQMTGTVWQSAFVAAVFALHPLHIESVAWIAERKDVLSTMFWLMTMIAYVSYTKNPNSLRYFTAFVLFALGLMAKPMLVTLPFVLLLLDYWPLERLQRKTLYKKILEKLPFFILAAASGIVTFLVQRSGGAVREIQTISMQNRAGNASLAYLAYITKMIWPAKLAVFYPHFVDMMQTWKIMMAALLLIAVSVYAISLASRHRYLFVGWFWFLGTLVPVIGIVQVGAQSMADRYTYVPLIGLFIIIAWAAAALLEKKPTLKIAAALSAVSIITALSICTSANLRNWRNSETLFRHALAVTKNNYVAHYSLGHWLLLHGQIEQAAEHHQEALRINPRYLLAHMGLGIAFASQGHLDQAVERFQYVVNADPNFADAHNNLGAILSAQGKFDEAVSHLTTAMRINPDSLNTNSNLGHALALQGNPEKGAEYLLRAIRLNPNSAEAHYYLALALAQQNKIQEAIKHAETALKLAQSAGNSQLAYKIQNNLSLYKSGQK